MKKGLTGFNLKYLALVLMVLDHIEYMFEFTGVVPVWFSWIGRLAAPLFLFCFIEGFFHTHNRRNYFLRIYGISVIMGLIQFGFYNVLSFAVRGDGFFPENAMLSSFAIVFIVLQGIEWLREKRFFLGIIATVLPIIIPYIAVLTVYRPCTLSGNNSGIFIASLINYSILPLHTMIKDGGTVTLLEALVLYFFSYCKNKKIRIYAYGIWVILWNLGLMVLMGIDITPANLLKYYEWMAAFSVIPMLCYNGKRGEGNAKLFYWFYPAHIYILYGLSFLLYLVIR